MLVTCQVIGKQTREAIESIGSRSPGVFVAAHPDAHRVINDSFQQQMRRMWQASANSDLAQIMYKELFSVFPLHRQLVLARACVSFLWLKFEVTLSDTEFQKVWVG